jgi:hypothetical protein
MCLLIWIKVGCTLGWCDVPNQNVLVCWSDSTCGRGFCGRETNLHMTESLFID